MFTYKQSLSQLRSASAVQHILPLFPPLSLSISHRPNNTNVTRVSRETTLNWIIFIFLKIFHFQPLISPRDSYKWFNPWEPSVSKSNSKSTRHLQMFLDVPCDGTTWTFWLAESARSHCWAGSMREDMSCFRLTHYTQITYRTENSTW